MVQVVILFLSLLYCSHQATYTRQSCSNTQIFNPQNLSCIECPQNMRPNPSQKIPTSCICNKGYFQTSVSSCSYLGTNANVSCANNQYFNVIDDFGNYQSGVSSNNNCIPCDNSAYSDINGTACVPCPRNMIFSIAQNSCVCINGSQFYQTQKGCFTAQQVSNTNAIAITNSKYYNQLKYLFPSCEYFKDLLSCSYLVNLCTYSMGYQNGDKQAQCQFFQQLSQFKSYLVLSTSLPENNFYISPGNFLKNQQVKFKLLYFLPTGNFVKQKQMRLPDLLRCGMPSNNSITIKIGSNVETSCSFDFSYLVELAHTFTYNSYTYQLFISGEGGAYFPVFVYIGTSSIPVKRFFMQDFYTSSTYINVLTSMKLNLFLNSSGYLVSPQLRLTYKKLAVQGNAITPSTDKMQTISYHIKFVYNLTTFWPTFFGIFIAINVLVLIQSLVRTYIAYLNKQPILGFFFYLANFWSLWMFYFLIVVSGYWFLFCKTTQNVYIFIPDSGTDVFYLTFYIIAGVMGVLRIIVVIVDKKDKLSYQVFVVNQQTTNNSWRQIFIINSLAQFYTHRTISFFWMFLCVLFFLVGLKWQQNAAEVAHTDLNSVSYFNPKNRIFLYFLGGTILLVIGIAFKILRRLSVIKWPYPFQDFVDYCHVTNISLFFMKKRSEQAYFIRASLPNRVQVSFKDINDAIRKGLSNKNRDLLNEYNLGSDTRIYLIYICRDLQDKFHNMIKRTEDQEQQQLIKNNNKSNAKNKKKQVLTPRQDFVRNKLKQYVQIQNPKQRSLFKRLIGVPQISLRQQNVLRTKNQVILDRNCDIVPQIFPNGNQFQEIHTIIIIFLMFLLLTNNASAAAFIAYFINQYLIDGWVASSCRKNLQKMTRVKQGFML